MSSTRPIRIDRLASLATLLLLAFLVLFSAGCGSDDTTDPTPAPDDDVLGVSDVEEVSGYDDVVLVDLTTSPEAPYQAAFERPDGERLAIVTIEDASNWDRIIASVEGTTVPLGDEGWQEGGAVYFRKGDRAFTIYTIARSGPEGNAPALTKDQVLELAELAEDRL